MSNRVLTYGGLIAAGGIGYYLYQAGGDPKTAQKKAEADATHISASVKDQFPGSGKEAKKDVEVLGAQAGARVDQVGRDVRAGADKADAKIQQAGSNVEKSLNQTAKDAEQGMNKAIDKFDKNVTEGASKAKSGVSSWFGGSK